ncbi:MAG: aminoglycoside phosphotransferase family protein [Nocardioidaceae bacterium]|nr:aminoglycoside phosphotransferase family protein [Nocardioidaceae bacterium]
MKPTEVLRALAATTSDASGLGLNVEVASVIQNANRLAVRLMPCDVLARVVAPGLRNHEGAAFEVDMARRLEEADCPVAVLEPRVEPLVHLRDGFAITYWRYYECLPVADTMLAEYAQALERLHAGMRQLDAPAPHFTDRVEEAQCIVRDRSQSPDLIDADRELLTHSLRSLHRAVVDRKADEQLLHGEPHAGNLLRTTGGMRFIDLETCCYGPVEFDIAHAPDEVGDQYALADPLLLRDCRILMLAMVAAWRAGRDDDFPNGRLVRDGLLRTMREALDRHGIDVRH